jgi:hypothetical protein
LGHYWRKLNAALSALQREAEQVKAGKISERESDERSRTVFAPMMREVVGALEKTTLASNDPRAPKLKDARRLAALFVESLAMASVIAEGEDKPQPIDPTRAAEINKEIQTIVQRLNERPAVDGQR